MASYEIEISWLSRLYLLFRGVLRVEVTPTNVTLYFRG